MSIWDAPNPTGTDSSTPPVTGGRDTPTLPADAHLMGTEAGPLLTSAGRGVRGGVPYGQQLQAEQRDMDLQYRLRPQMAGPLRAATRAALGR